MKKPQSKIGLWLVLSDFACHYYVVLKISIKEYHMRGTSNLNHMYESRYTKLVALLLISTLLLPPSLSANPDKDRFFRPIQTIQIVKPIAAPSTSLPATPIKPVASPTPIKKQDNNIPNTIASLSSGPLSTTSSPSPTLKSTTSMTVNPEIMKPMTFSAVFQRVVDVANRTLISFLNPIPRVSEAEQRKQAEANLDQTANGILTAVEVYQILNTFKQIMGSRAKRDEGYDAKFDLDKNGIIDAGDLKIHEDVAKEKMSAEEKRRLEVLKAMDSNQDGRLTREEADAWIKKVTESTGKESKNPDGSTNPNFDPRMDSDGDGIITQADVDQVIIDANLLLLEQTRLDKLAEVNLLIADARTKINLLMAKISRLKSELSMKSMPFRNEVSVLEMTLRTILASLQKFLDQNILSGELTAEISKYMSATVDYLNNKLPGAIELYIKAVIGRDLMEAEAELADYQAYLNALLKYRDQILNATESELNDLKPPLLFRVSTGFFAPDPRVALNKMITDGNALLEKAKIETAPIFIPRDKMDPGLVKLIESMIGNALVLEGVEIIKPKPGLMDAPTQERYIFRAAKAGEDYMRLTRDTGILAPAVQDEFGAWHDPASDEYASTINVKPGLLLMIAPSPITVELGDKVENINLALGQKLIIPISKGGLKIGSDWAFDPFPEVSFKKDRVRLEVAINHNVHLDDVQITKFEETTVCLALSCPIQAFSIEYQVKGHFYQGNAFVWLNPMKGLYYEVTAVEFEPGFKELQAKMLDEVDILIAKAKVGMEALTKEVADLKIKTAADIDAFEKEIAELVVILEGILKSMQDAIDGNGISSGLQDEFKSFIALMREYLDGQLPPEVANYINTVLKFELIKAQTNLLNYKFYLDSLAFYRKQVEIAKTIADLKKLILPELKLMIGEPPALPNPSNTLHGHIDEGNALLERMKTDPRVLAWKVMDMNGDGTVTGLEAFLTIFWVINAIGRSRADDPDFEAVAKFDVTVPKDIITPTDAGAFINATILLSAEQKLRLDAFHRAFNFMDKNGDRILIAEEVLEAEDVVLATMGSDNPAVDFDENGVVTPSDLNTVFLLEVLLSDAEKIRLAELREREKLFAYLKQVKDAQDVFMDWLKTIWQPVHEMDPAVTETELEELIIVHGLTDAEAARLRNLLLYFRMMEATAEMVVTGNSGPLDALTEKIAGPAFQAFMEKEALPQILGLAILALPPDPSISLDDLRAMVADIKTIVGDYPNVFYDSQTEIFRDHVARVVAALNKINEEFKALKTTEPENPILFEMPFLESKLIIERVTDADGTQHYIARIPNLDGSDLVRFEIEKDFTITELPPEDVYKSTIVNVTTTDGKLILFQAIFDESIGQSTAGGYVITEPVFSDIQGENLKRRIQYEVRREGDVLISSAFNFSWHLVSNDEVKQVRTPNYSDTGQELTAHYSTVEGNTDYDLIVKRGGADPDTLVLRPTLDAVLYNGPITDLAMIFEDSGLLQKLIAKPNDGSGRTFIVTVLPNGINVEIVEAPPTDTTPPTISAVASSNITSASADITWTTDEAATTQIEYGLTIAYGNQTTLDSNLITAHSQTLSTLETDTLFHYRVTSCDVAGNCVTSDDFTFTTLKAPDTTLPGPVIEGVTTDFKGKVNVHHSAIEGAVFYQMQVAKDEAFTQMAHFGFSVGTTQSFTLTGNGTYYVRVRGSMSNLMEDGLFSEWSETVKFDVNIVPTKQIFDLDAVGFFADFVETGWPDPYPLKVIIDASKNEGNLLAEDGTTIVGTYKFYSFMNQAGKEQSILKLFVHKYPGSPSGNAHFFLVNETRSSYQYFASSNFNPAFDIDPNANYWSVLAKFFDDPLSLSKSEYTTLTGILSASSSDYGINNLSFKITFIPVYLKRLLSALAEHPNFEFADGAEPFASNVFVNYEKVWSGQKREVVQQLSETWNQLSLEMKGDFLANLRTGNSATMNIQADLIVRFINDVIAKYPDRNQRFSELNKIFETVKNVLRNIDTDPSLRNQILKMIFGQLNEMPAISPSTASIALHFMLDVLIKGDGVIVNAEDYRTDMSNFLSRVLATKPPVSNLTLILNHFSKYADHSFKGLHDS